MDHTVTGDNVLTEGIFGLLVSVTSVVEVENKLGLEFKLLGIENIIGNSNGRIQSVVHVTRTNLLRSARVDASGFRSLSIASVLLGIDGTVSLTASEVASQSCLRKNVELEHSLLIESANKTINLRKSSIGGSKHRVW
ncbi:unnamed protein product [Pseudo-nitzschia multistriata]|uniref:Uncharacterized protein n=1 Tax=Pseudo-nitzschia multistriata TaxID=183589 RepID=A0A448ZB94_9STRA|nr:unnamed protein product [Pseudo-nitzschia multistriata]